MILMVQEGSKGVNITVKAQELFKILWHHPSLKLSYCLYTMNLISQIRKLHKYIYSYKILFEFFIYINIFC